MFLFPPVTVCHTMKIWLLFVFLDFVFQTPETWARVMGKREKSKSTGGKCVSEYSTGEKPGATQTSNNPFETSRTENPHNFVDTVKENGLETIILSSSSGDVTFLTPFMTSHHTGSVFNPKCQVEGHSD